MKKKLVQLTALFLTMATLTGCTFGKGSSEIKPSENPVVNNNVTVSYTMSEETVNLTEGLTPSEVKSVAPDEKDIEALSKASVKLASNVANNAKGRNFLLSPTSINFALGMTENGAEGETLKQMEEIINGGVESEKMNQIMNYTSNKMGGAADVDWNVANSVWFKDDGEMVMNPNFLEKVISYYDSELYKAPFDQSTLNDINGWVNKETRGMIPVILDSISEETKMYLINAIAFEGEWEEKYEENDIRENYTFTNADGSETDVTMLYSKENKYFTLGEGEGFVKNYKGGQYAFVGILPKEGQSTDEYLRFLDRSRTDLAEAVKNARYEDVRTMIPEFKTDYDIELSDIYKEMNMERPFDPGHAEFDQMMEPAAGDTENYDIWISKIIHKTHIEVDRKGTKAAAATAVAMDVAGAMPIEEEIYYVYLDRPFVYAIVDTETGLPIFLGCQNSMN